MKKTQRAMIRRLVRVVETLRAQRTGLVDRVHALRVELKNLEIEHSDALARYSDYKSRWQASTTALNDDGLILAVNSLALNMTETKQSIADLERQIADAGVPLSAACRLCDRILLRVGMDYNMNATFHSHEFGGIPQ